MLQKIRALITFALVNFGPLVIFYGTNHFVGLKVAIAVSTAYSVAEITFRLYRKEKITTLFKFSAAMTFIFGIVDHSAQQSFLFKYESSVSNLITGIFFGLTLFSERTIMQEYYERNANALPMTLSRVA